MNQRKKMTHVKLLMCLIPAFQSLVCFTYLNTNRDKHSPLFTFNFLQTFLGQLTLLMILSKEAL